jgi:hypothetical protein
MKYLFALTIILFHATSFAKWQYIGHLSEENRDEYYDDAPIGKGNFPKIWILWNYKKGHRDKSGDVIFSQKSLYEFSCRDREVRLINMTQYDDNFAAGKIIYSTASNYKPKWDEIPPGTIVSDWYKIVCK